MGCWMLMYFLHTHTHTNIYIYIYIERERERERERDNILVHGGFLAFSQDLVCVILLARSSPPKYLSNTLSFIMDFCFSFPQSHPKMPTN
jgi:hypothetical protein